MTASRKWAIAGGIVCLIFLAWLRWPSAPAWQTAWHASGLPTTLAELDAWYAAFGVTPGQALYLAPGDRVRVW